MRGHTYFSYAALLLTAALCLFCADAALAQGAQGNICTWDASFNIITPAAGTGIISTIVMQVMLIISTVAQNLYNTILASGDFQLAVRVTLTVYVAIYGIMFIFGMTEITLVDFAVRAVKVGIVAMLIMPGSWTFFYSTVGMFFRGGTDELIGQMTGIAAGVFGNVGVGSAAAPFAPLDNAIVILASAKMQATLIAIFMTGPYGLIFGLLLLYGLGQFAAAIFQVMWIYLMSVVVMAFLFALAPMFFAFILFERTRNLFDGWLNQLVSCALQPIFLFAFFAFFSLLVQASLIGITATPVCKTEGIDMFKGTPFGGEQWRFAAFINGTWQPYGGPWSFTGADFPGAPVVPWSVSNMFCFVLLVALAFRFNGVAVNMAKDIAGSMTNLDMPGAALSDAFSPIQKTLTEKAQSMGKDMKTANSTKMQAMWEMMTGKRKVP